MNSKIKKIITLGIVGGVLTVGLLSLKNENISNALKPLDSANPNPKINLKTQEEMIDELLENAAFIWKDNPGTVIDIDTIASCGICREGAEEHLIQLGFEKTTSNEELKQYINLLISEGLFLRMYPHIKKVVRIVNHRANRECEKMGFISNEKEA